MLEIVGWVEERNPTNTFAVFIRLLLPPPNVQSGKKQKNIH